MHNNFLNATKVYTINLYERLHKTLLYTFTTIIIKEKFNFLFMIELMMCQSLLMPYCSCYIVVNIETGWIIYWTALKDSYVR